MKIFQERKLKTFFLLLAILIIISSFSSLPKISSQSSQEYNDLIQQKNKELQNSNENISELENQLNSAKEGLSNSQEGLPRIEAQIKELESQILLNRARLGKLVQDVEVNQLQVDFLNKTQKKSVKNSYVAWRSLPEQNIFNSDIRTDFMVNETYSNKVFDFGNFKVETIAFLIDKLESDKKVADELSKQLDQQNIDLANQKIALEEQIRLFNSNIAGSSTQIAFYKDKQSTINKQINDLLVEQQKAAEREAWILQQQNQNSGGSGGQNTNPNDTTSFGFSGSGRDLYQGHGVGMSQWGAHGMGVNGFTAQQILTTYYAGVSVTTGYETATISVAGYGGINIEDYVSGQAEVPAKACGNAQQAASRPDKYVLDNPGTSWDCWPEEAIKAQLIAFRTYGLHYVTYKSGTICATAACQVYNGSQNSRWGADETKGQVILARGALIEALYSADNSQGYGTANNDTIFQNLWGDGTPYSYLRAVNDSAWASRTSWTNWNYGTAKYSGSDILAMLSHIGADAGYSQSIRNSINQLVSSLGENIQSIYFERDPSQRVKKIFFTSTNGTTRSLGGWWFKNFWNSWTYNIARHDYIYSQTFFSN